MRFSRIDDRLSVYQNVQIVIFGASVSGKDIWYLLNGYGFSIVAFCDNDQAKWGTEFMGKKVISPIWLKEMMGDNVLVQIASYSELEIEKQLLEMEIYNYILYWEAKFRLENVEKYLSFRENPEFHRYFLEHVYNPPVWQNDIWVKLLRGNFSKLKRQIFLVMPPKTGDNTLMNTFEENGIEYLNFWHTSYHMKELVKHIDETANIKLVTAIREPISQNLSILFEYADTLLWDQEIYWKDGGDVNRCFEFLCQHNQGISDDCCIYEKTRSFRHYNHMVQNFFEEEYKNRLGIDLLKYPFDKERGYSVYRIGRFEVFVYQIEKLNSIYNDLFAFLGCEKIAHLVNGNEARNKYYHRYYIEAQEQLEFSKEYFDWCFDGEVLNHFYSKEDIEKFREKWESHIK